MYGPESESLPKQYHIEEEDEVHSDNNSWGAEKVDDDEQPQQEVEVEPQPMDDPHDVSVVTQYHLRVDRSMYDGVVRFYNFNFCVLCFFYVNSRLFFYFFLFMLTELNRILILFCLFLNFCNGVAI